MPHLCKLHRSRAFAKSLGAWIHSRKPDDGMNEGWRNRGKNEQNDLCTVNVCYAVPCSEMVPYTLFPPSIVFLRSGLLGVVTERSQPLIEDRENARSRGSTRELVHCTHAHYYRIEQISSGEAVAVGQEGHSKSEDGDAPRSPRRSALTTMGGLQDR